MLITVFFNNPCGDLPYSKAIIDQDALDFFMGLGATREPDTEDPPDKDELDDPPDFEPDIEPDMGFGEPGSMQWHENQLAAMNTKKDVIEYVGGGWKPAARMTLPKMRATALKLLGEAAND